MSWTTSNHLGHPHPAREGLGYTVEGKTMGRQHGTVVKQWVLGSRLASALSSSVALDKFRTALRLHFIICKMRTRVMVSTL